MNKDSNDPTLGVPTDLSGLIELQVGCVVSRTLVKKTTGTVTLFALDEGEGLSEVGRDARTGEVRISVDPAFFRPSEVDALIGDATKAHERLGWSARIGFEALVEEMVRSDIARLAKGS